MDGMQLMAGAMRAARVQLENAAYNLSNADSDGFRKVRTTVTAGPNGIAARRTETTEQGAIRTTGRRFDLALIGPGAFDVDGAPTRSGAFTRVRDGGLADDRGRRLRGEHGLLHVSESATIESDGSVRDGGRIVERLRLPAGTRVESGALEGSNVDTIGETLAILDAERAFETAQKTFAAIDQTRQKAIDDVGRLR